MKNDRWTGVRRLGRGQGGHLGQRAEDSVSEESAREHLPDTRGCSSPHFQASQLLFCCKASFPLLPLSSTPHSSWASHSAL